MRFFLSLALLALPQAAFACAMYIPSTELARAMEEVDQAAKPAVPADAKAADPKPAEAAADQKPEGNAAEKPADAPANNNVIPEAVAPAS